MIDQNYNPSLPPRQTFICKIVGHPFISRTDDGTTVCNIPVEISGLPNRARLIVRGRTADNCLYHHRIGAFLKVTGIKKVRPLTTTPDPGAQLIEIVAWTAEPRNPPHKKGDDHD